MRKILTLTAKEFFTGLSPHIQISNQGLWATASGMNPFITPGIIKPQGAVTDLTSTVVKDVPLCSVADTTKLYILGDAGHLYQIADVNTVAAVTDKRSATPITNPATGITVFQPQGGTKLLYYWQKTQIGTWDLSGAYATGWTDNVYTGLQDTTFHPVHKMFDEVYYGNKDRIGQLKDDGSAGVTHTTNVLNFPTENTVTALSDDGTYLIAAVSKSTSVYDLFNRSKVIFWDKYSSSWNKEWTINDPVISSMQERNGFIYAWGARGLYIFNFSTPPTLIRRDITALYGYPHQTALYNDAIILGEYTYGKVLPGVPEALFKPFGNQMTGTVTMVSSGASSNYTYFGTASSKLYYMTNNSSIAANARNNTYLTTVYIPLGDRYDIKAINVIRYAALSSGETIHVSARVNLSQSDLQFTEMSYTVHGAVLSQMLYPRPSSGPPAIGDHLSLELNRNMDSGTGMGPGQIKQIDVYGEPYPHK